MATWSQTVLNASRHAELAALAVRHAVLERGVAHLVFPDQVQTLPANGAQAAVPEGRLADLAIAPPAAALQQATDAARGSAAPGDHRRHRRAPGARGRHRAGRAPRRARDDDLPCEGADRRRPSARLRDARPQRHADRVVGHERGRRAARDRRVVRQPHRHLRGQADRARRPRPAPARSHDGRSRSRCSPTRASRRAPSRSALPARAPDAPDQAADVADRRALWATEKARPRRGRPRTRRRECGGVRRAQPPRARERGDRGRRREPCLQLRALPRVARRSGRADVRPARVDRVRLSRRDRRVGGHARGAPDHRRDR